MDGVTPSATRNVTTSSWAKAATPPPLLPGTAVFEPPRARRKRRWFLWVGAGLLLFMFCNRDRSKPRTHEAGARPSPAAEGDSLDSEARAARDAEIERMVERGLRGNPRTRRKDIEVDVDEGIVSLSGHAPAAVAHEAEAMARGVPGVREVLSTIDVAEAEGDHATHGGPGPNLPAPPVPPVGPGGRPGVDAGEVEKLMREARQALKDGKPGEAMGKYGAVMGMDPDNQEARQGMKDATIALAESIGRSVSRRPPSPEVP